MDQETEESSTPDQQKGSQASTRRCKGCCDTLTTAMNCNQPKEVEMKLAALDEAVMWFRDIHDMYHKTLEDDDDLDASNGYLMSVLRDVQDLQHTVLNWLEDFKPSMELSDASNFQEEQQMLDEADKPQMSPVDQLSTQFQELQNLRQKENEFSVLLAQQEERLRAEFKLQLQQAEFEMDGLKGLLELKDAKMEENRQKAELTTINKDFSTPVSGNPSLNFRPSLSAVNENSLSTSRAVKATVSVTCWFHALTTCWHHQVRWRTLKVLAHSSDCSPQWLTKRQCRIKRNSLDCISTLSAKLEMLSHIACTTLTLA